MMLDRMTWDQAEILNLRSSRAFTAVGIPPATVRRWAADGLIKPIAQGPNGSKLYHYPDVINCSNRERKPAGRHAKTTCL